MGNIIEKKNIDVKHTYSSYSKDEHKVILILSDKNENTSIEVNSYDFHRRRNIGLFMRRFINNSNMFVSSVETGKINNIKDFFRVIDVSYSRSRWASTIIEEWATSGVRLYDTHSSADITIKVESITTDLCQEKNQDQTSDVIFKLTIHDKGDIKNIVDGETIYMIVKFKYSKTNNVIVGEKQFTFNPMHMEEIEKTSKNTYFSKTPVERKVFNKNNK